MADNNSGKKVIFTLDLDTKEYTSKIQGANKQLKEFGGSGSASVGELIGQFKSLAATAGSLYIVYKTIKGAFHAAMAGEKVELLEKQFESLTRSVGVAGDALKENLAKASKGLIDDTDQIQIANQAVVQLGSSVGRLPEVFEAARKSTKIFGGDFKDNIENLNFAIANGNTRMLKRMGLSVDLEKAERAYAKSLGVTVNELTEQDKIQARLNAVTEKAKSIKTGDGKETTTLADSVKRLNVALSQLTEVGERWVNSTFGKFFQRMVKSATTEVETFTSVMKSVSGQNQIEDKIKNIETMIKNIKETGSSSKGWLASIFDTDLDKSALAKLEKELAQLQRMKEEQKKKEEEAFSQSDAGKAAAKDKQEQEEQQSEERRNLRRAARLKFEKEFDQMRDATLKKELDNAESTDRVDQIMAEQKKLRVDELIRYKDELAQKTAMGEMTQLQATMLAKEAEKQTIEDLANIEEQSYERRTQAAEKHRDNSKGYLDGISRAWKAGAVSMENDTKHFGQAGKKVMTDFTKYSTNAFIEIGKGEKKASEIAKGFFFNFLADQAESEGAYYMAKGIGSLNPAHIAAGAALLALSGLLRSKAGGGGGGGVGVGASAEPSSPSNAEVQKNEQQKKSVTIQVQGNYFETEQTKTRLLEMIRESTDATDFKYVQIGSR